MALLTQKTINKILIFEGITLHKGKIAKMKILPSAPNTGINFKRVDLKENNIIPANFYNVKNATLCTTLINEVGVCVSTVEHLMAAFYGLGVDNAVVEIDQDEVPIMDGSSKNFVESIEAVGLKQSDEPIKLIKILNKVTVNDGNKFISIEPSKTSLEIDFEIKFNNELIGTQKNSISVYENNLNDIFNSRTFCLYEDVEKLKSMNLAQGGSLKNAIVVKGNMILNEEKLRNKKEFVNHKILDLAGDFMLAGYRVIGSVRCKHGGHELTNNFLKKVLSDNSNFAITENSISSSNTRKVIAFPKRLVVNA